MGAQDGTCQGMLRNILGDEVEDTELFLHFAVDVSVLCRQRGCCTFELVRDPRPCCAYRGRAVLDGCGQDQKSE